jgi:hypothetical protein
MSTRHAQQAVSGTTQAFVRLKSSTTGDWIAHPELRSHLVDKAKASGTNLNQVAVAILAEHYDVSALVSRRRRNASADQTVLNLRLPNELAVAIKVAAAAKWPTTSWLDEIRTTLESHFGLTGPWDDGDPDGSTTRPSGVGLRPNSEARSRQPGAATVSSGTPDPGG